MSNRVGVGRILIALVMACLAAPVAEAQSRLRLQSGPSAELPPTPPPGGPGCVSSCVECRKIYVSDCDGGLWKIDPFVGVSEFIGWNSAIMFDIGISSDGYLFGIPGPFIDTAVYRISACDASDCFDGMISGAHNSLCGDLTDLDLMAAGPPLVSAISESPYTTTVLGGAVGMGPGDWCGVPSGDIAMDPTSPDNDVYITLSGCAACPGGADMLAIIDPDTGALVSNVGCIEDPLGDDIPEVFGLAFTDGGELWGMTGTTDGALLSIDPSTGVATEVPLQGGPTCATGLASIPCPDQDCDPDLSLPTIECGVTAGPCTGSPGGGAASIVTECGEEICLYATASDNCGILDLVKNELPALGSSSPDGSPITQSYTESYSTPGVYDVSWTASDSQGNEVTCSVTVDARCDGHCVQIPPDAADWWPLDELAPTSTSEDIDGDFPNDGTHVGGPIPMPGHVEGALCFGQPGDFVVVPDHPEVDMEGSFFLGTAEDFTIDMWVQAGSGIFFETLLDKRSNEQQPTLFGYKVFLQDGYVGFEMSDGSAPVAPCDPDPAVSHCTEWVATSGKVDDGDWHFIAITVQRLTPFGGRIYVDGVPVLTFDPTPRMGPIVSTSPLFIGGDDPTWGSASFFGCLDEIEIFKRALTSAEIEALHRADREGKCKCDEDDLTEPCPIGQEEYDSDGDGCPDGCLCDDAFPGTCPNCPVTVGVCNPGGFDCGPNSILFDSDCDCVYDQCALCPPGTYPRDTNGDGCEDVCDCYKEIILTGNPVGPTWNPDPSLPWVDVIVGTISGLKQSRGDFSQSTLGCLANDEQGGVAPYPQVPPVGDGVWFLLRPVTPAGSGTYDSSSTSHEGRDPGIGSSGRDCPM